MRNTVWLTALLLLVGLGWIAAEEKKRIGWVRDYAAGMKAARAAKKPVFIDFMTGW